MIDYVHGLFKDNSTMRTPIGVMTSEVILSHTPPNTTAALVVPPDVQAEVDDPMRLLLNRGLNPRFTAAHPATGAQTVAFMPLPPGRVAMVRGRGFRHGDPFSSPRSASMSNPTKGQPRREMWLVDARPPGQAVA